MQQRLFDTGWSDESECQACHKEKLYHCPEWYEVRREIPEAFQKVGTKCENLKERVEVAKGSCDASLFSESQWNRGHFSMKMWESEKHKSWSMPAEGFMDQVATDGSWLGRAAKWGACVWAVVQLDYDEEMGPLHGMCGSMGAELEVQRTVKRTELTASLCLLKRVIGPVRVHVDNKGIVDGLRRGEREMHRARSGRCRLVDQDLGRIAKGGPHEILCWACWTKDSWLKQEQRQSSRSEKRYAALQYAASFHCLVEEWTDCEELKPKPKEKWGFRG